MKQVIWDKLPSGFIQSATVIDGQLHAVVEDEAAHDEAICALKWDGQSPWVEVLKGDLTMPKLAFLGWPMEDRATYEAKISAVPIEEVLIDPLP